MHHVAVEESGRRRFADRGQSAGSAAPRRAHLTGAAVVLCLIVGSAADLLRAPKTPLDERARTEWQRLVSEPRLPGTPAHLAAGDLILSALRAAGVEAEEQRTTIAWERRPRSVSVASVRNIIGRLRGRDSGRAVAIASHYDTVAESPGAGDSGIAVAAMLDAARTLTSAPAPASDVLFVFTDAEEAGLLGARAFIEQHPWAASVRTVLNFDARGARGPLLMFETGPASGRLVPALADQPVYTNSLMAQLYETLPNDTDFTVWKRHGLAGMNFAFVAGSNRYHTATDDTTHVEAGLIGDESRLMVTLAQGLAAPTAVATEPVYFSLLGGWLVTYPALWTRVLALAVAAFALGILIRYVRVAGGWRDAVLGVAAALGSVVLVYFACATVVALAWRWNGELLNRHGGDMRLGGVVLLGTAALGGSIMWAVLSWHRTAARRQGLQLGYVLLWTIAAVLTSTLLPRASFLFVWPAVCGCCAAAIGLSPHVPPTLRQTAPLVVGSIGMLLVVPMAVVLFAGLTSSQGAVITALFVAQLGLSTPLQPAWSARLRLLPLATAVASIALCGAALLAWRSSREYMRPPTLFLAIDGDTRQAVWATSDPGAMTDARTSQVLTPRATRTALPAFFPGSSRQFFVSPPNPISRIPALDLRVSTTGATDARRLTSMEVSSDADRTTLRLEGPVDGVDIGGRRFSRPAAGGNSPWTIDFLGAPARSTAVQLALHAGPAVTGQVVAISYRRPSSADPTRRDPAGTAADATLVRKGLRF